MLYLMFELGDIDVEDKEWDVLELEKRDRSALSVAAICFAQ